MIAHSSPAQKKQQEKLKQKEPTTVEAFSQRWLTDIVERSNQHPKNIIRILKKDVIPLIGKQEIKELTPVHIQVVVDKIKVRVSDHVVLLARNIPKRILAYAISRRLIFNNPAVAIEAKYIAQASSREVALTPTEIGILLRAIYTSSISLRYKLTLHLLILCMVKKSELTNATWD